jgi:hypothetical protein
MAVTSGTVHSVHTLKSESLGPIQIAEIIFTMSGTYAQADNSILAGVAALIQNSRRNGKTVNLMGASPSQAASSGADYLGLKTCAIATADVTFELTLNSYTTEFTNATAIPTQNRPFGMVVSFIET